MAEEKKQSGAGSSKKKKYTGGVARAYILSTFNNTIVNVTDEKGNTLAWASAGGSGFKGTKKGTPFAAQMTAASVGKKALDMGVKQVAVFVNGPGPGRETAIRGLQSSGLGITAIKDITPVPHDGCRPPKPRRV
ncbi:MAG: 30S ribosomal protein S11 [Endomicrobia bacterium]|nr:30S ribosomal protein S11 [Endomicrobiia bacterium]MCL2799712.1 30S ribosomal protein S11 [Endomicrobiia bacterium]